jgi:F-type H+-transporting ATPase subunit b
MDILKQLGELVLGSLPTVVLFLLTIGLYSWLFHRPLKAILAERHRRTVGAVEQARAAIASAEAQTEEYEGRLRLARNAIAIAREHRVQQWNAEREQALSAARERAQMKVRTSKLEFGQDIHVAKQEIERSADRLAESVLAAVLPTVSSGGAR